MPSLLVKVKTKMSIYAQRKARTILDGNYDSVYSGRGIDFEDLYPYTYGDDIKSIDWKATARSGQTLIRRYIATRKHNIVIVADTGKSMAALANPKETKHELAVYSAGIVSYIAQKHNDPVAMYMGDSERVKRFPLKETTSHLENVLHSYQQAVSASSPTSNVSRLLDYFFRNFSQRAILFTITDLAGVESIDTSLLKRLNITNEHLIIIIKDANPFEGNFSSRSVRDMNTDWQLPTFLQKNKKLLELSSKHDEDEYKKVQGRLRKLNIASTVVSSEKIAPKQIITLMEKHRHARKR